MKYYVFSAGKNLPQNQLTIEAAKSAYEALNLKYMLDNNAVGACYAKLIWHEDIYNVCITVEDDYDQRVCDGVKEFCYWHCYYERLLGKGGV